MATTSNVEMVFKKIRQLDCWVIWQVGNLTGIPVYMTGTKLVLLKVVLRELSSVELEGAEVFKKIGS